MSNHFDNIYGIEDSMAIIGATPSLMATQVLYKNRWIPSRYDVNFNGVQYYFDVSLDKTSNGAPIIMLKNEADIIHLSYSAYDVYKKYRCDDNVDLAANWQNDLGLNTYLAQKQAAIQQQQMMAMQPPLQQGWTNQQQQNHSYQGYPKPRIDIDFFLDNTSPKDYLSLDTCLYDKNSLIYQLPNLYQLQNRYTAKHHYSAYY